ncbi:glutamate/gamma-aminobutyrate family transporter YjeM [Ligilactobacillus cholophilus]|uniref:glutamate/gamma-aminobutyrate family transporter YjeM n=1 Tax=Ligilactobacillus cholophilus TaxID=3050131 RepID=UPI0025AED284|nr:glutamate/gamma-aminobutyrate family transporter YjeM [Ligilactobacillus cholophilus]
MENRKKMSVMALVLMIFASIFGLGNVTTAYYQMGYGAIIWYIAGAILFFIPTSLMFAEYGSALKGSQGGIYSWLETSLGEKPAFIGAFVWYAAWVITLLSQFSTICIPISGLIFGKDTTQSWHLLGLNSTETLGIIGIGLLCLITWLASRGFDKIEKVASASGIVILAISGLFIAASILMLFFNHGHLAQPISVHAMVSSPNSQFKSPIAILSFFVYAVFAYAGMETMGGTIDQVDKPERNFPRGIIYAGIGMISIYALGIFLWGVTANWNKVLGANSTNLGNITLVLMQNLGYTIGREIFHLSVHQALIIGNWTNRLIGFEEMMSLFGSMIFLIYSPLKTILMGSPKRLWPEKLTKLNDHKMPAFAMWMQAIVMGVVIFGVSFGGRDAQQFYTVLTDMNNVTSSVPYLFLIFAFPFFKRVQNLNRPFEVFKNQRVTDTICAISWITIFFGIIFTIIQPVMQHDGYTAFWTAFGPVFFALVGWLFYRHAVRNEETVAQEELD